MWEVANYIHVAWAQLDLGPEHVHSVRKMLEKAETKLEPIVAAPPEPDWTNLAHVTLEDESQSCRLGPPGRVPDRALPLELTVRLSAGPPRAGVLYLIERDGCLMARFARGEGDDVRFEAERLAPIRLRASPKPRVYGPILGITQPAPRPSFLDA